MSATLNFGNVTISAGECSSDPYGIAKIPVSRTTLSGTTVTLIETNNSA